MGEQLFIIEIRDGKKWEATLWTSTDKELDALSTADRIEYTPHPVSRKRAERCLKRARKLYKSSTYRISPAQGA